MMLSPEAKAAVATLILFGSLVVFAVIQDAWHHYTTPDIVERACDWCSHHPDEPVCGDRAMCSTCVYDYARTHGLNLTRENAYELCPPDDTGSPAKDTLELTAVIISIITPSIAFLVFSNQKQEGG